MIITEKNNSAVKNQKQVPKVTRKPIQQLQQQQPRVHQQKIKPKLPSQLEHLVNEGGISISPIKPATPPPINAGSSTQLVVVVNETGSHYALALPNGSKIILTPEQLAQIRASNGGKLVL